MGQQHTLCAIVDFYLCANAVRPVEDLHRHVIGYGRGIGIIDVALPAPGELGTFLGESLGAAAVEGQDLVFARFDIPHGDHFDQFVPVLIGQIAGFGEIFRHVIQLPAVGIQFAQFFLGNLHLSEGHSGLGKGGPRNGAYGAPAVVVDRSVAEHLEILGDVAVFRLPLVKGMSKAHALDGRLGDAADFRRRLDLQGVQYRRQQIDGVSVLRADFPFCLDTLWPMHDERIADTSAVGFPLPALERGVARPGPAPGVMIEILRAAQIVQRLEIGFQGLRHIVEELVFVDRAGGAALGAGAVVGDHHHQGVVQLAKAFDEIQQPANVMVGMLQKPGEDFHHAGVELFLVRRKAVPAGHVGVVAG